MSKPPFKKAYLYLLIASTLMTGGCTAAASLAGTALYENYKITDTNLNEKSYAAADYLIQQSSTYYDRFTPIQVLPLRDFDRPELSSKLGRLMANQIGSRFGQLGYRVDLSQVPTNETEEQLFESAAKRKPEIIITGTYKRSRPDMPVTVRIMEAQTGYTISSFQYYIPYNGNARQLSEPEIRIMRVTN